MATKFMFVGPYPVKTTRPQGHHYQVVSSSQRKLWKIIKNEHDLKMTQLIGCYIYTNSNGTPIYVGKTCNRFGQECFTEHKRNLIDDHLYRNKITTQCVNISFICYTGKKPRTKADKESLFFEIDQMETYYIRKANDVTDKLLNSRKINPSWKIDDDGFLNKTILAKKKRKRNNKSPL